MLQLTIRPGDTVGNSRAAMAEPGRYAELWPSQQASMSERYLFRSDWRPSRRRILLAGLLGHYAAAYCFCASTMLAGFVDDLQTQGMAIFARTTWSRAFEVLWTAPVVTGLLGLWGAVLISPTLLLTLPATSWAARRLDTAALPTAAIGVLPGILAGLIVFGIAPQTEVSLILCSAVGGAAFALVVWLLCIRPRRPYR
ncbi:hypothetical protein MKK63_24550 [Methylobacterium sp. J-088]|uniref:hypothetical protein n=1 Tax=Methylobacterium sp. J-088 TaxID=2836664 RepID=UPI001FB93EA2|nr:hypothetical protein [Methylobacterium sp. J-088]MCJ2065851.1 hypothetical protein [Methylobacterium sp. J-088]